jgi:delta14-sterol reductase
MYTFTFLCNDISGCPVPATLSPSTLTLAKLKKDAGWPANGVWGLASWDVTLKVLGYYAYHLILYAVLPGEEVEGLPLTTTGVRLKYKFNSEWCT